MTGRPLSDLAAGRRCYCIYTCYANGLRKRRGARCSYCRTWKHPTKRRVWPDPVSFGKKSDAYQRRRDKLAALDRLTIGRTQPLPLPAIRAAIARWEAQRRRPSKEVIAFLIERATHYYFDGMGLRDSIARAQRLAGMPTEVRL